MTTAIATQSVATFLAELRAINERLRELDRLFKPYNAAGVGAMLAIEAAGGSLHIAAVGVEIGTIANSMTSLADRLERDGFITRGRAPSDRRQILLSLTDRGQTACEEARNRWEATQ